MDNPIIIGLILLIPTTAIGYLGYRRSKKADVATDASVAIGQIIGGLNQLVDNLQIDNRQYRRQLAAIQTKLESTIAERDELRRKIVALGGMACLIALLLLGVESVKQDQERLVTRAARVARIEAAANTQQRVDDEIKALGITTTTATAANSPASTSAPSPTVATLPTTSPSTTTTTATAPPIVTVPTVTTITLPVTLPTTIPLP